MESLTVEPLPRRGLHQRHIQMIALAGTIGTGLFLSSGKAIARGGPLGALYVSVCLEEEQYIADGWKVGLFHYRNSCLLCLHLNCRIEVGETLYTPMFPTDPRPFSIVVPLYLSLVLSFDMRSTSLILRFLSPRAGTRYILAWCHCLQRSSPLP